MLDVTARPIFLPTVPDRKPRTECACQPVAFISSLGVTPAGFCSRLRTRALLLPARAPLAFFRPLGGFFAKPAFLPDLAFAGTACGRRSLIGGFLFGFAQLLWAFLVLP